MESDQQCRELRAIVNQDQRNSRLIDLVSQINAVRLGVSESGMSDDTADNIARDFARHLFREAFDTGHGSFTIDTGGFDLDED
jgi:hypothetical protein